LRELLTLEEVAEYLRVTNKTIYRLLEKKAIPAVKVGRLWRFNKSAIDRWLKQNSTEVKADILVIDDDDAICSLFKDTLEGIGHAVTAVNESAPGLDLIKEHDYSLVFLDLKMPDIDGPEVFRQIRLAKPDLPVTIITGYPDSDLMMKALSYGPMGVLSKPFTSDDIITAAKTHLSFKSL
jgi:excisionase family DNA binding protein